MYIYMFIHDSLHIKATFLALPYRALHACKLCHRQGMGGGSGEGQRYLA